jgi:hypothetical protein
MAQTEYYGRTPLPAEAKPAVVATIPLWLAVIFSPFVAFAVNGKVDDSDWTPAFVTAGVALLAIALLSARRRAAYRNLPAHLRDEYERGKCFGVLPNARARLPATFKLTANATLQMTHEGIVFSPAASLGQDSRRRAAMVRRLMAAVREGRPDVAPQTIAWRDIKEWEVHEGSDSDDTYRLALADGGYVRLRRPADAAAEYALLDAVRGAGRVPVRVFCDVRRVGPG